MSVQAIELDTRRDTALKIALAVRSLPDTDPERLLKVLDDCIGLPLTQKGLDKLTPGMMKKAAYGDMSEIPGSMLRKAISYLKGEEDQDHEPLPSIIPYKEGDMPGSVRIACASNGGEMIDGHFGSCARFLIYQVSTSEIRLIDIRSAAEADEAPGLKVDRPIRRAEMISDCEMVIVCSIGGPPAAKVTRLGIHPIRLVSPLPAREKLSHIQTVMSNSPPRWLQKKQEANV